MSKSKDDRTERKAHYLARYLQKLLPQEREALQSVANEASLEPEALIRFRLSEMAAEEGMHVTPTQFYRDLVQRLHNTPPSSAREV